MGLKQRKREKSLGMLILNFVLICAMIINGTYAWINIGQSVNGALLYINEEYEVVLQKYERTSDGEYTDIPMEGVGFALFTESGEQIGGVRFTDEDGKIYATVPVGSFYFEEVYYLNGWGPDTDEDGEYIWTYEFTITGNTSNDESEEPVTIDNSEEVTGDTQEGDTQEGDTQEGDAQTEVPEEEKEVYYIEVYNKPLETSLEIEKVVENLDGTSLTEEQLEQEFEFTVIIGDENSYNYTIKNEDGTTPTVANEDVQAVKEEKEIPLYDDQIEEIEPGLYVSDLSEVFSYTYSDDPAIIVEYEGTITSGDTLYLKHGQVAIIEDIPMETYYQVTESRQANYYTETENVSGNITFGVNKVKFINIYDTQFGRLRISKEVQGEGFDPDQEFEFTATINGQELQFTLKDGETHLFESLPIGSTYKVEEYDYVEENFYAYPLSYEGTLMEPVELELPFINMYNPGDTFGDLVIYKEVIQDESDELEEDSEESEDELEDLVFSFQVVFENADNPDEPQVYEFDLMDGEFHVLTNIPVGTPYTVIETDAQGYLPDFSEINGYIIGKKYDDTLELNEQDLQIVTFYNRKPAVEGMKELTVTKLVTGDIPELDKDKEFEFTLSANGVEEYFTLKDKETKVFELPAYTQYEVTEKDYIDEGYSQTVKGGSGTIYQEVTEVTVINDYQREMIDIQGEKTWDTSFEALEFYPEYITINLMLRNDNGIDTIVESVDIYPEGGVWTYAFQALKDDATGVPYEYYVLEEDIQNFVPNYTIGGEYDIYNEYVQETSVEIPLVEKQIEGISTTNTKFTFVITAIDGAPMPSGVVGDETVRILYGEGETVFGSIKYTEPGTYRYTITEVNDGLDDWIYDEIVYNYEVVVEAIEGKLVASKNLNDGLGLVSKAIFINEYIGEEGADSDDEDDEGSKATHFYLEGTKTWEHGLNSAEHRPLKLVVYVLGDGEVYQAIETSASKNWSYKFLVPILNDEGETITYTIGEEPVDGYNGLAIGYDLYNTFDLSSLVEPDSPQTSDYSQIWIWVWGLVASTITFAYVNRRKRVLIHGRRW